MFIREVRRMMAGLGMRAVAMVLLVAQYLAALLAWEQDDAVQRGTGLFIATQALFGLAAGMVVPVLAHRALVTELAPDILEPVRLTRLTPGQIIRGHLGVALVSLLWLLGLTLPFVAAAYAVGGVDLPRVTLAMSVGCGGGIVGSAWALAATVAVRLEFWRRVGGSVLVFFGMMSGLQSLFGMGMMFLAADMGLGSGASEIVTRMVIFQGGLGLWAAVMFTIFAARQVAVPFHQPHDRWLRAGMLALGAIVFADAALAIDWGELFRGAAGTGGAAGALGAAAGGGGGMAMSGPGPWSAVFSASIVAFSALPPWVLFMLGSFDQKAPSEQGFFALSPTLFGMLAGLSLLPGLVLWTLATTAAEERALIVGIAGVCLHLVLYLGAAFSLLRTLVCLAPPPPGDHPGRTLVWRFVAASLLAGATMGGGLIWGILGQAWGSAHPLVGFMVGFTPMGVAMAAIQTFDESVGPILHPAHISALLVVLYALRWEWAPLYAGGGSSRPPSPPPASPGATWPAPPPGRGWPAPPPGRGWPAPPPLGTPSPSESEPFPPRSS